MKVPNLLVLQLSTLINKKTNFTNRLEIYQGGFFIFVIWQNKKIYLKM